MDVITEQSEIILEHTQFLDRLALDKETQISQCYMNEFCKVLNPIELLCREMERNADIEKLLNSDDTTYWRNMVAVSKTNIDKVLLRLPALVRDFKTYYEYMADEVVRYCDNCTEIKMTRIEEELTEVLKNISPFANEFHQLTEDFKRALSDGKDFVALRSALIRYLPQAMRFMYGIRTNDTGLSPEEKMRIRVKKLLL